MKLLKVVFLFVLAVVAIPIGITYGILDAVIFGLKSLFRSVWGAIYSFFRGLSKVVSVCSSRFLSKLLIIRGGVPFGTHSVSAVLGANEREKTLSVLGFWLVRVLDSIEENHCKKASERAGI